MDKQQIVGLIKYFDELLARVDAINLSYDDMRKSHIPKEVSDKLSEIEAERATSLEYVYKTIEETRERITKAVVEIGESVESDKTIAMYVKGRTTWDSKKLEGYAVVHPEILSLKNVGKPSVTIKAVGGQK